MITSRAHVDRARPRSIDTSKVVERLRDEAEDALARARRLSDEGAAEAIFWAEYAIALLGLLDDQWALTVIAIHEMGVEK